MPSLSVYKNYLNSQDNGGNTVGRFLKEHSDFVMEETWDNDIQSKRAYIYDYYHDDQPELNRGMTWIDGKGLSYCQDYVQALSKS